MLQTVDTGLLCLAGYELTTGAEAVAQLRQLAEPLRGCRVLHLNATPYGGGVAEILRSEVPLLRDLGLEVRWKIITGDNAFFKVTKAIHNGLQGADRVLTSKEKETYLANSTYNARLLEEAFDLVVVHDPQPLALLQSHGKAQGKWLWRCHIDTSDPNAHTWDFLRPFLEGYDAAVFTLGSFVPPHFPVDRVEIIPPAIDPHSPKNMPLDENLSRHVLEWIGVDIHRPLLTQVARFDPWKDPLGVIAAYRLVKREMPDLQLALVGSMALDDPEGWDIYQQIKSEARSDRDIRLFTNLTGVGNIEVNAFQRLSDVILQKSIREGFGLVVSESLWKETPVVAGRSGGIPLQMQDGAGGFLVDSVEQCAERALWLLHHPAEGQRLAQQGREVVRKRFLLTRLIADELRLYAAVLGSRPQPREAVATVALRGELRDPVCGMKVEPSRDLAVEHEGRTIYFCSAECRQIFRSNPGRFGQTIVKPDA
jgi:trehalose synthase